MCLLAWPGFAAGHLKMAQILRRARGASEQASETPTQTTIIIMQHYTVVRIVLYRILFVYETVLRDHAIRCPWLAAVRFEGITAHARCNTVLNLLRSRRVPLTLYRVCSFFPLGSGFEPAVSSTLCFVSKPRPVRGPDS